MIACMRASPKAPRVCLLASTFWSSTTWLDSVVMFCCALSMTASRSASRVRFSWVWRVVSSIDWPSLWPSPSIRSDRPADEVGLARAEDLGDGLHPALHLALGADQFGELRLEHGAALGARHRPPPGDEEHEDKDRHDEPPPPAAATCHSGKTPAADLEGPVHSARPYAKSADSMAQNMNEISTPRRRQPRASAACGGAGLRT